MSDGKIYIRQGLDAETEYSLNDVEKFLIFRKRFKSIFQVKILEWFFPNKNEPARMVIQKPDGTQFSVFSYSASSPRKRYWDKFAKLLKAQTGKDVILIEAT